MKHVILGLALLTGFSAFAQDNPCPNPNTAGTDYATVYIPQVDECFIVGFMPDPTNPLNYGFVPSTEVFAPDGICPSGYVPISNVLWDELVTTFGYDGLFAVDSETPYWNGIQWIPTTQTNASGLGLHTPYSNSASVLTYWLSASNQISIGRHSLSYSNNTQSWSNGYNGLTLSTNSEHNVICTASEVLEVAVYPEDPTVYNCTILADTVVVTEYEYITTTVYETDTVYVDVIEYIEVGVENTCPTDINEDGITSTSDLLLFLPFFETTCE